MCRAVERVCILRGLRLQRARQRIKVGTKQRDVVHTESTADYCLLIVKRPVSKTKAWRESQLGIVLQAGRKARLAIRQHGHARCAIDCRVVRVVNAIRIAGVRTGQK